MSGCQQYVVKVADTKENFADTEVTEDTQSNFVLVIICILYLYVVCMYSRKKLKKILFIFFFLSWSGVEKMECGCSISFIVRNYKNIIPNPLDITFMYTHFVHCSMESMEPEPMHVFCSRYCPTNDCLMGASPPSAHFRQSSQHHVQHENIHTHLSTFGRGRVNPLPMNHFSTFDTIQRRHTRVKFQK